MYMQPLKWCAVGALPEPPQGRANPDRGTLTGTGEGAAVGFTVGAILQTVGHLVTGGRRSGPRTGVYQPPAPSGVREQAAAAPSPVTQDDIASPIATDLIAEGRAIMQDGDTTTQANDILRRNSLPEVDTRVVVTRGDRQQVGTVVDAFRTEANGMADDGIKVALNDGTTFEARVSMLRHTGATILPVPAQPAEGQPAAEASGPRAPTQPAPVSEAPTGPYVDEFRALVADDTEAAAIISEVAGRDAPWSSLTLDERTRAIVRARERSQPAPQPQGQPPVVATEDSQTGGVTRTVIDTPGIRRYDRPGTLFYLDPPYHGSEADYGRELFGRADFELAEQRLGPRREGRQSR